MVLIIVADAVTYIDKKFISVTNQHIPLKFALLHCVVLDIPSLTIYSYTYREI